MNAAIDNLEVYRHESVRKRMLEFMGGDSLDTVTSVFLALGTPFASHHLEPHPVSDLDFALEQGLDISRSLWDRQSLLAHLDIDYVNFDRPGEIYAEPERAFDLMRPVTQAVTVWLASHDVRPLHLFSGRGHHFVWKVRRDGPVFDCLAKLGRSRVPPTLQELYRLPHPPAGMTVDASLAGAYVGLGLIMEFVAQTLKNLTCDDVPVPVELTGLRVGPGPGGRVLIALDISEYGDPLHVRVIRMPFSMYHKPSQQRHALGADLPENLPPMYFIPAQGLTTTEGIRIMRSAPATVERAQTVSTRIPEQSEGMSRLLAAYTDSPLREFHEWYYAETPHPPERWPDTYDRAPHDVLPGCVRFILAHPNDLLLKLSCLQRVVRTFLSLGWHPRHIAGLIQSIYERDHGWSDRWRYQNAAWRAEFYARLFAGLVVTGTDGLIDFNCRSAQEEQLCFVGDCRDNLADFRQSLRERKQHERLARRPIHRLFLSETDS